MSNPGSILSFIPVVVCMVKQNKRNWYTHGSPDYKGEMKSQDVENRIKLFILYSLNGSLNGCLFVLFVILGRKKQTAQAATSSRSFTFATLFI